MATKVEPEKLIKGNITKEPAPKTPHYRDAWIANVNKHNSSKPHPFCHGIQMDTHHLISEKAIAGCESDLQEILIDKGYDINSLDNLVGIPATFRGACHLGVQVHRGDHKFSKNQFEEIKNFNYHREVKKLIVASKEEILQCNWTTEKVQGKRHIHEKIMDPISQEILDDIIDFSLPLTSIHSNFNRKNKPYVGCGQAEKVGSVNAHDKHCQSNGKHFGEVDVRPGKSHRLDSPINFKQSWVLERKI
ncbi:hypothetical protein BTO01_22250 [Vibrio jasicida]|uniref:AHH domain-containing protein n=1 Tax=Vibrio jasicida TaxID=766224 RepID=UPI000CF3AA2E|nr:AHH domain-containing protein [Vibrio jasicida]PQJ55978.1 hypothetical protein BTO01_22250 [Vibrio jasicida]